MSVFQTSDDLLEEGLRRMWRLMAQLPEYWFFLN